MNNQNILDDGKAALLKSIAQSGYNIGFGAKKHFITFDLYRILPKFTSFFTLGIGVLQLTDWYKKICGAESQELFSVFLIIIGLLAFTVDLVGKGHERYKLSGEELISKFNRLRNMYNQVKALPVSQSTDLQIFWTELHTIEADARMVSIAEQAICTHIATNVLFFNSMQVDWLVKELNLGIKDKFPFLHIESFVLYAILIAGLIAAVQIAIDFFGCPPAP